MKYTEKDIKNYLTAQAAFNTETQKFDNRVEHVLKVIAKVFSAKLEYWYFHNAEEGERGTCRDYVLTSTDKWTEVDYILESKPKILSTGAWDYADGFPRMFLFMTDKEIEDFIKKEIKDEEKKAADKKAKTAQSKKKKEAAKEAALAKLSKDDREALGV